MTSSCITHMPHFPRLPLSVKRRSRTSLGRQFYRWDHDILCELTKKKELLLSHSMQHWNVIVVILTTFSSLVAPKVVKMFVIHAYFFSVHTSLLTVFAIDQFYKSHNASVPYPTMHHSEQKCAHFCSEWCIVGYGTDALWDLWISSIGPVPVK